MSISVNPLPPESLTPMRRAMIIFGDPLPPFVPPEEPTRSMRHAAALQAQLIETRAQLIRTEYECVETRAQLIRIEHECEVLRVRLAARRSQLPLQPMGDTATAWPEVRA